MNYNILSRIRNSVAKRNSYVNLVRDLRENADDIGISPLNAEQIARESIYGN